MLSLKLAGLKSLDPSMVLFIVCIISSVLSQVMMAFDWSILILWPACWFLIGPYLSCDLQLVFYWSRLIMWLKTGLLLFWTSIFFNDRFYRLPQTPPLWLSWFLWSLCCLRLLAPTLCTWHLVIYIKIWWHEKNLILRSDYYCQLCFYAACGDPIQCYCLWCWKGNECKWCWNLIHQHCPINTLQNV